MSVWYTSSAAARNHAKPCSPLSLFNSSFENSKVTPFSTVVAQKAQDYFTSITY